MYPISPIGQRQFIPPQVNPVRFGYVTDEIEVLPIFEEPAQDLREAWKRLVESIKQLKQAIFPPPLVKVIPFRFQEEQFWPNDWEHIQETFAFENNKAIRQINTDEKLQAALEQLGGIEKLYPEESRMTVEFTKTKNVQGKPDFRMTVDDTIPYHFDLVGGYASHDFGDHFCVSHSFTPVGEKAAASIGAAYNFLATGQDELYGIFNRLAHSMGEQSFSTALNTTLDLLAKNKAIPDGAKLKLHLSQPLSDRYYSYRKPVFRPQLNLPITGYFTPTPWDKICEVDDPKTFNLYEEIVDRAIAEDRLLKESTRSSAQGDKTGYLIQFPEQRHGKPVTVFNQNTKALEDVYPEDFLIRINLLRDKESGAVRSVTWHIPSSKDQGKKVGLFSRDELFLLAQGLMPVIRIKRRKDKTFKNIRREYEKKRPNRDSDMLWDFKTKPGKSLKATAGDREAGATGNVCILNTDIPTAPTILSKAELILPEQARELAVPELTQSWITALPRYFQWYQETLFKLVQYGRLNEDLLNESSIYKRLLKKKQFKPKENTVYRFDARRKDITHQLAESFGKRTIDQLNGVVSVFSSIPGPTTDFDRFLKVRDMQLERLKALDASPDPGM